LACAGGGRPQSCPGRRSPWPTGSVGGRQSSSGRR
jgi:hypothetical protein